MIDRLVQIEQERLHSLGYDTVVTPSSIVVDEKEKVLSLANESFIMTGIRIGNNDLVADTTTVQLISPTESIECTQRELSQMGTSINKLFKTFLIIKVKTKYENVPDFRLDFIRVSPVLKT